MKRWTKKEEEILKQYFTQYSVKEASDKASKELNRTPGACYMHYYEMQKAEGVVFKKGITNDSKYIKEFKKRVQKNPNNLAEVFRTMSKDFGISYSAVKNSWYGDKKSYLNPLKNRVGFCFSVMGKRSTMNRKNCNSNTPTDISLWNKIKSFFKKCKIE